MLLLGATYIYMRLHAALELGSRFRSMVAAVDESMSKFKIKVARIETGIGSRADPHVCVTFQIKRAEVSFQVPIRLSVSDYDDTEMVQAARSALHRTFAELAAQSPGLESVGDGPAEAVAHELASEDANYAREASQAVIGRKTDIALNARAPGEGWSCPLPAQK